MNDPDGRPIVVSDLQDLGNDVWSVLVTTPDGVSHRLVVPGTIATVSGVQIAAQVVSELAAKGSIPGRQRLNYG